MIAGLLGRVTPWLLAALIGIAIYAGMQARHYAGALGDSQARVARAEDRAAILIEHQRWQRKQIEALGLVLQAREAQLQRDDEIIALVRQAARNLERDDAETGDWAGRAVPGAVDGWLRDLRAGGRDGTDSGSAGSAVIHAGPAAGPGTSGEPQP